MTDTAYPFKTLDQAKAVREASERVNQWTPRELAGVKDAMPQVAKEAGHLLWDWLVTVETQRRSWETPVDAAERVAKWVTLWAEVYDTVPTERAIQRTAIVNHQPDERQAQELAAKPYPHRRNHW